MKTSVWIWGIIELVIWYGFIYYFLYVMKNPVDLWSSSAILLILASLGFLACPWVQNTTAWRRTFGKEE